MSPSLESKEPNRFDNKRITQADIDEAMGHWENSDRVGDLRDISEALLRRVEELEGALKQALGDLDSMRPTGSSMLADARDGAMRRIYEALAPASPAPQPVTK